MEPYYQDSHVTIYNADCREILPDLPKVDLVLTDPPYGLAERWQGGTWGNTEKVKLARKWDIKLTQNDIQLVVESGENCILWGGNYYQMPPCRGLLAWVKLQKMPTMSDFEIAWTTFDKTAKCYESIRTPDGKSEHATAKPIKLMRWCIEQAGNPETILDPFMGSGTTLRAAKDLNRKAIGIEISEKYCEIGAKRMAQEVMQF